MLTGCDPDFSPFDVLGLRSASRSCAWSFPLSCFVSSGRARGVGCRQCPGNARSFCRTIAAALISPVPMVCYFNQYQVPSAFTNQGLLYVAMIFVSCGGGPVHKRAVFFQWEKYRYKLTSDLCALASTPFLQIVQLRTKGLMRDRGRMNPRTE